MQIRYKILNVKDVYEKVLEDLWLAKVLNKSAKSIKKVLQVLKSVWKSPPAENPHHAKKPANQPALQVDWLVATKRRPKTTGELRTDQSTINTCYLII